MNHWPAGGSSGEQQGCWLNRAMSRLWILFLRGERDRSFDSIHAIVGVPTGQASRRWLVRHVHEVFSRQTCFDMLVELFGGLIGAALVTGAVVVPKPPIHVMWIV